MAPAMFGVNVVPATNGSLHAEHLSGDGEGVTENRRIAGHHAGD